jgi:hypothetical protein
MKKAAAILALCGGLALAPMSASAGVKHHNADEVVGIGAGAAAGFVIGGPVGAVVGGLVGLVIVHH